MRIAPLLLRLLVFALAGAGSVVAARMAVEVIEDRSRIGVQEALLDAGLDWTSVAADGLMIILEGEAPDEATAFRARTVAGTVVDSSRVQDDMLVAGSGYDTAPDFGIEMLRNDAGITVMGLIPATTDRDQITDALAGTGAEVADLLDGADYAVPEGWNRALSLGLRALALLPRATVSVSPGDVTIEAIADSEDQRQRWLDDLRQAVPPGVNLSLTITAPRPVITPFTVRFVKEPEGARFDACAADTAKAKRQIERAARAAGALDSSTCELGLGAPSIQWGDAVALAIAAVDDLGGGTLTFADADVLLAAPMGTDPDLFDSVIGRLGNALPPVFSLDALLPEPPEDRPDGPPRFTATLSPEGDVQLRGKVADELSNLTAETFAKARFGHDVVQMGTLIAPDDVPADWAIRVLAALEGLSKLASGDVTVLPDTLTVRGRTGLATARGDISRVLINKLGKGARFTIDVTYDEALDPLAGLPTPDECLRDIQLVNEKIKISFEPGAAQIVAGARTAMDQIAEILQKCPDLPLQIAGYTDSQGREVMNRQLSQDRADAVVDALRSRRLPVGTFRAIGFGEDNPIATNDTPEGREANRRIEFSLMADDDTTPAEEPTDE